MRGSQFVLDMIKFDSCALYDDDGFDSSGISHPEESIFGSLSGATSIRKAAERAVSAERHIARAESRKSNLIATIVPNQSCGNGPRRKREFDPSPLAIRKPGMAVEA